MYQTDMYESMLAETVMMHGYRGESVTNLGGEAFSACSNLTSVMIGTGLRYGGGSDCFADCIHLTGITVDPLNPAYSSLQGVLFDKSQIALFACPAGKAGSYRFPAASGRSRMARSKAAGA